MRGKRCFSHGLAYGLSILTIKKKEPLCVDHEPCVDREPMSRSWTFIKNHLNGKVRLAVERR